MCNLHNNSCRLTAVLCTVFYVSDSQTLCYQGFLWHVTSQSLCLHLSSPFSSRWCYLLTHLQFPSLSTWFWYPPFFHSSPDHPSLLPSGSFTIQPAQSIFSTSQTFSAFPLRRKWGYGNSTGSLLLPRLACCFSCTATYSPFRSLAKLGFLLSETEIAGSGDRCCHRSLLVSSSCPWGAASIFCHLWMHPCLFVCKCLTFNIWIYKIFQHQTTVGCCWYCHPLFPVRSLWKCYDIIHGE